SMARGRVRLPFKVQFESMYEVQVFIEQQIIDMDPPCEYTRPCTGRFAHLPLMWTVFKGDREVAQGSYPGTDYDWSVRDLGRFHASPGEYVLELEKPEDGSRYDRVPPWIVLDGTDNERYRRMQEQIERQLLLAMLLIVAGVYIMLREWPTTLSRWRK